MNWEHRKEFPKDAYKEFVIRFRWKHNGENLQWTYLVVHTAMMPNHLFDKEWQWLDESAENPAKYTREEIEAAYGHNPEIDDQQTFDQWYSDLLIR